MKCQREENQIVCIVRTKIDLTRDNIRNEFAEPGAYDILTYAACDELEATLGLNQETYWFMWASFEYGLTLEPGLAERDVKVFIPWNVWIQAWDKSAYEPGSPDPLGKSIK